MHKVNTFQIIVTTIFGLFILVALVVFATMRGSNDSSLPPVTIWGTVPQQEFMSAVEKVNLTTRPQLSVTYVQIKEENFEQELIEALASRVGPDIIMLPHDLILKHRDKIYALPNESITLRQFKDTYVELAELYTVPEGVLGLPFTIDPLVMYWNRDIFQTARIPTPIQNWEQLYSLTETLTQKDPNGTILRSTVAFGEYGNVNNAKEILSALFLQAGTSVVTEQGGLYLSNLNQKVGVSTVPAESVLNFYTAYSNPNLKNYSWNKAMTSAQNAFIAGDLALYFGFASEYNEIAAKNPNLNFDITLFPQPEFAQKRVTFGKINAFAVLNDSKDLNASFQTIVALSGTDFMNAWMQNSNLAPARRDLLSVISPNPVKEVVYDSAIISQAWLDPDKRGSNQIFDRMVTAVTSGRLRISQAVANATLELNQLLSEI